ncbi:hypothetical protein F5Y14DRAFT_395551 [Nemania sp. NC0429]|nr:hypothetical protein F5Y14DRAFT_395551 [Nemania sp. NC0429]
MLLVKRSPETSFKVRLIQYRTGGRLAFTDRTSFFVPAPLVCTFATTCLKFSVHLFSVGMFMMPKVRTTVFIVNGLTVALRTAVVFESFLLCWPFAHTWDKTAAEGHVCGDMTAAYIAIAIENLIVDFNLVLIPMPVLWQLQLPGSQGGRHRRYSFVWFLMLTATPGSAALTVAPDLIFGARDRTGVSSVSN